MAERKEKREKMILKTEGQRNREGAKGQWLREKRKDDFKNRGTEEQRRGKRAMAERKEKREKYFTTEAQGNRARG